MVKTVLHIKQCSDIFPENSSLSIINFKALSKPVINSWPFASSILPVQSATKPVSISCGISIMMWWFALNLKLSARIYWQSCTGCGWHDVARGGLVEINGCTHLVTESRKELKKKKISCYCNNFSNTENAQKSRLGAYKSQWPINSRVTSKLQRKKADQKNLSHTLYMVTRNTCHLASMWQMEKPVTCPTRVKEKVYYIVPRLIQ